MGFVFLHGRGGALTTVVVPASAAFSFLEDMRMTGHETLRFPGHRDFGNLQNLPPPHYIIDRYERIERRCWRGGGLQSPLALTAAVGPGVRVLVVDGRRTHTLDAKKESSALGFAQQL